MPFLCLPAFALQKKIGQTLQSSILRQAFKGSKIETVCRMKNKTSNWTEYKLEEICSIIAGQSPNSDTYNREKIGLPFYQGKADFGLVSPNPTVWCSEPIKIAEKDDILLSVRAPVGPINITSEECCIGRGLCAIRTHKDVYRKFIIYYFKLMESKISKMGNGSTFQAITIGDVKNLSILMPSYSEQKCIADIIETKLQTVEKVKKAVNEQLSFIDALRSSILRQAFKGKL
jgi:type I restriction enzyme S subunit